MIKGIKAVFPLAFLLLMMQMAYIAAQSAGDVIQQSTAMPMIGQLATAIVAFFISALPVILIETLWPREPQDQNWLLASSIWIVTISFRVLVVLAAFRLVRDYVPGPLFRLEIPDQYLALAMPLVFLGYKVLIEFFKYWFHRAQHHFHLLWQIHKVHHSIQNLSSLNSTHHFLAEALYIVMVTVPLIALVQVRVEDILILSAIFASWGRFIHANTTVNLGRAHIFLADPAYHRLHHSQNTAHHNRNFAVTFPLLDVVFGTYLKPSPEPVRVGLKSDPEPRSLLAHVLTPFRLKSEASTPLYMKTR